MASTTLKRGIKAKPASKPGKWDKPDREVTHTKSGPGRKRAGSANAKAPRVMAAPEPLKKFRANIGGSDQGGALPFKNNRRIWRDGEPVHIVSPVRAARIAAEQAAKAAA